MNKKDFDIILLSNPPAAHLNSIFKDIPKIFIPLFDTILLDYYLYFFKYYNFKKIFIIFYESSNDIVDFYLGSWFPENFLIDMELNIFREKRIVGNVGAIKELEKYILNDNLIVFNTGAIPKFDIESAINYHLTHSNNVTIIALEEEISSNNAIPDNYCFIMKKELLKFIPEKKYVDFKNIFTEILNRNNITYSFFPVKKGVLPFLTFEDYINLIKEIIAYPEPFTSALLADFILETSNYSAIHKKAFSQAYKIESSVIGRNCIIKKNSIIKDSVISDNVTIGQNVTIEKSFIKPGSTINDGKFIVANFDSINIKYLLDSPVVKNEPWERVFDIILLILSLPLTLPLIAIVSLILLIFDGRPIFFTQRRLGKDGKPFKMIKFRTMRKDADSLKDKIRELNETDGPMFKISNDPRITKIGKFLRKTSLDELPQLLNILKGEMSFVGPRPLEEKEMSLHPQWRDLRLKVKPGLTGLWQVMKSKDETFSEWIEYDTYYITHKNIFLYFKIILLTFLSVIKSKNK